MMTTVIYNNLSTVSNVQVLFCRWCAAVIELLHGSVYFVLIFLMYQRIDPLYVREKKNMIMDGQKYILSST